MVKTDMNKCFQIELITLFPEYFNGPFSHSIIGTSRGIAWDMQTHQLRDFALDKHRTVDDTPYGGGSGMVIRPDVLGNAIEQIFLPNNNPIVYLTPRGRKFDQKMANQFASGSGLNILCGRYEGIDERVILEYDLLEVSLGDFVLTSGDAAAVPFIDCIIRQLPGVLGEPEGLVEESFAVGGAYENLLEYPHYTRPQQWKGHCVPDVLASGNHQMIAKWRYQQALEKTRLVRPELLDQCNLNKRDEK